jgi:tartrate-resistant acid phosphatase type 5
LNHSDVHFITSGGGSKAWQGMQTPTEEDGLQFGYDGQGFVSVSMTVASLHLQFHDALGSTLYSLDLKKTKSKSSKPSPTANSDHIFD